MAMQMIIYQGLIPGMSFGVHFNYLSLHYAKSNTFFQQKLFGNVCQFQSLAIPVEYQHIFGNFLSEFT